MGICLQINSIWIFALIVYIDLPKTGQDESPYEIFTGKEVDYLRDFRAEWGKILPVKKPKQLASDLNVTGEWAAVVRRIINGTGVLKVYLVQSKKYAYRLHFKTAKAPEWVLEELQNLKTSAIGFEIEEDETTRDLYLWKMTTIQSV